MFDVSEHFKVPMLDLANNACPDYSGIFIAEQDVNKTKVGITNQFLDDACYYHMKYTNTDYFKWLINNSLSYAGYKGNTSLILDVGSGSGNTVFPLLEIFPDSKIVATDLSPNLLAIMKLHAESHTIRHDRLAYVCMDVCDDIFVQGSFDLVIGAAILHHLIEPVEAIYSIANALQPGGTAIFFEPFENGNAILRLAYSQILVNAKATDLSPAIVDFLKSLINDYTVRTGTDKTDKIYKQIDDKWLFTRKYIEKVAIESGFSCVQIYPIHDLERPFSHQTETNLRLGKNFSPTALPLWAWEIIGNYDSLFSTEMKHDMLIEGAIILKR